MRMAALAVMLVVLLAAGATAPRPALADGHSEEWCADAVDFAMRTAQYRDLGRSRDDSTSAINRDARVFHQEYPELSTPDMLNIARAVYEKHWTHFGAASAMSKACKARPQPELPTVLTLDHSDEWCANAVDFAMGVAQNRQLEFTQQMISSSFDQNPTYYHMQFPELSRDEMLGLTEAVYRQQWTRFGAAATVGGTCRATQEQKS
ncbi:MAG TPA: hypothetical protein VFA75_16175 [Nevskia sp.]|nr:hypothetical protein [Nevskia sp.]